LSRAFFFFYHSFSEKINLKIKNLKLFHIIKFIVNFSKTASKKAKGTWKKKAKQNKLFFFSKSFCFSFHIFGNL